MTVNVLVAYSSKHGATAGIAQRIGARLRAAGAHADVLEVAYDPEPGAYDAVVLGSAVYMGAWRHDAVAFAHRHELVLAATPLWLFSSGPLAEPSLEEPKSVAELRAAFQPREHMVFAGALDKARLSLPERIVISAVGSQLKKDLAGDFRDWGTVDAWADGIAQSLALAPARLG